MKNQVRRLTDEEARELAEFGFRESLPAFVALADWRNQSGSTAQIVPAYIRDAAERLKEDSYKGN